jgi:chromosome segregation ATPase
MLITVLEKEQRAKREAWRDNNQLKKRIAELEAEVKYIKLEAVETDAECDAMTGKIAELEAIIRGRDELINNAVSSRIAELETELSFYANCSYSSSWVTGDKNHVMEDRGDRASNYLFGKAEPRKSCNKAIEALKEQDNG